MSHPSSCFLIAALPTLPGIDGKALYALFHHRPEHGLLGLYDHLVGGALSNGSLLALGVLPYLSARLFVRIGRALSPRLEGWASSRTGQRRLTRWTRVLTGSLALIQSYGFTRFALSVPGVVAAPGPAFVVRTMTAMTLGALCMMWMGEQASVTDFGRESEPEQASMDTGGRTPAVEALPSSSVPDALSTWRVRSAELLRVTPMPGRAGRVDD